MTADERVPEHAAGARERLVAEFRGDVGHAGVKVHGADRVAHGFGPIRSPAGRPGSRRRPSRCCVVGQGGLAAAAGLDLEVTAG